MVVVTFAYIVLSTIIASLIWWYIYLFKFEYNKILGPKPLPLLGNIDIGSNAFDSLENLTKFSKIYGNIYKIFLGPTVKIVTTNADLIGKIVQSNTNITKSDGYDLLKPWLNDGLLVSTGLKWKLRRKLITPSFHLELIDKFLEIFDKNANVLVEKLRKEVGKSSTDLVPFLNNFSLDVICETSMGCTTDMQNNENHIYGKSLRKYLDIAIDRLFSSWKRFPTLFRLSKHYKNFSDSLKNLHNFSNQIIESREKTFNHLDPIKVDEFGVKTKLVLLDALLSQKQQNNLTLEDIREEIDTFIFEGHDTVTAGTTFALYAIANHPEIQRKLYEEITQELGDDNGPITSQQLNKLEYLDAVVRESLRFYPSVPYIERQLEEGFTFGDHKFSAGTRFTLFIYGMHHSNEHFPEPEKFNPERFSFENTSKRHKFAYLPFSAGPRNCIGRRYALTEMKSTLIKVLQNFELLPVPGFKLQLGGAATLQSRHGVCVRIKLRAT